MNNSARQHAYTATERIKFSDIASGVAFNLFTKLPNGVIALAIDVIVLTPFNSATSDVLDIGHAAAGNAAAPIAASANAYKNDADLKGSAAGTKIAATTLPGLIDDAGGGLQITGTWTGVGAAPTQGEFLVVATLIEDGREQFSQG